jgi:hypothetical protein
VEIVTLWQPGDAYTYELEIGTTMSLPAGRSESTTSYRILVEVLEWTGNGYLVQWTYKDAVPPEGATDFEKRVVEMSEGISVRYYISELGAFIDVENWEEIAQRFDAAFEGIVEEFSAEPELESSIGTILTAFDSKEGFVRLAMEEIRFYHMLHGYSYRMGEPLIVEGDVENPFGGTPIHAETSMELVETDSAHHTAYLIYTRTFEPADLNRAIFETLHGNLPEGELTDEQLAELPDFDMNIEKQFIFHTASGWLLEAYSMRYAQAGTETRTDTIYMRFLE